MHENLNSIAGCKRSVSIAVEKTVPVWPMSKLNTLQLIQIASPKAVGEYTHLEIALNKEHLKASSIRNIRTSALWSLGLTERKLQNVSSCLTIFALIRPKRSPEKWPSHESYIVP